VWEVRERGEGEVGGSKGREGSLEEIEKLFGPWKRTLGLGVDGEERGQGEDVRGEVSTSKPGGDGRERGKG
jgi:hypothetical protein